MSETYLQVLSGVRAGTATRLEGDFSMGRAPVNQLIFSGAEAQTVSARHAVIYQYDYGYLLRDLGSTNGTYVNGEPVRDHLLKNGDEISLGREGPKLRFIMIDVGNVAAGRSDDRRPAPATSVLVDARQRIEVASNPNVGLYPEQGRSPAPSTTPLVDVRGPRNPSNGEPTAPEPLHHGAVSLIDSGASPQSVREHPTMGVQSKARSSDPGGALRSVRPVGGTGAPAVETTVSRRPQSSGPGGQDASSSGTTNPSPSTSPVFGGAVAEIFPAELPDNIGEHTVAFAYRIKADKVDSQELQDLIKDNRRVQRIVDAGILSRRDAQMISSASATYSASRKRTFLIVGVISTIAFILVGVLLVQNLSYRWRLQEQQELLTTVQALESQLTVYRNDSEGHTEEREQLVSKLRVAERQLMGLRTELNVRDQVKTYKHPLGAEIDAILEGFGKRNYIVPDLFIEQVDKQVATYSRSPQSRAILAESFANKPYYEKLIEKELAAAGMPHAFLYLSMHESRFDPQITSAVGARGLWQLMPSTARELGLKVPEGWKTLPPEQDERTDPRKSTAAGVKYLKGMLAEFGDVALAMAAYNAGAGRIRGALRKIDDPINNRDFWFIYRMQTLAPETNEYVPKIIATMVIDRNRVKYGF